jgi:hypothetical protein
MLAAGASNRETARELNVSESIVSTIKLSMPAVVRPKPELPPPQPVEQIGVEWSEEYKFAIRIFSPAWAAGDLGDE